MIIRTCRLLFFAVAAALLWAAFDVATPWPGAFERAAADVRDRLTAPQASAEVAIVALPRDARLDTAQAAALIDRLDDAGAAVIALVAPLAAPTTAAADAALLEATADAQARVVLGRPAAPAADPNFLAAAEAAGAAYGHLRLGERGGDPRLRRFPGVETNARFTGPSFAMAAAQAARSETPASDRLSYAVGPAGTADAFVVFDALMLDVAPDDALRGRVVIVGAPNPDRIFRAPDGALLSDLDIHAQATAQLLAQRQRRDGPLGAGLLAGVVFALAGAAVARLSRRWAFGALGALLVVAVLGAASVDAAGLWAAPLIGPGAAAIAAFVANRRRADPIAAARLAAVTARSRPTAAPAIVQRAAAGGAAPFACAIIRVDARGLGAALARRRAPTAAAIAARYDSTLRDAARDFGGYLSEALGDRWTIAFGVDGDAEFAGAATRCANALRLCFAELEQAAAEDGVDCPTLRIGVAAGRAALRAGLTKTDAPVVFGPAVETAGALATMADAVGVGVALCEEVVKAVKASDAEPPRFRPLGDGAVAGRPLRMFIPESHGAAAADAGAHYAEGFARLEQGAPDAAAAFRRALVENPDDEAAALHLRRLWSGARDTCLAAA